MAPEPMRPGHHPLDDCPWLILPDLYSGSAGYVSSERPDDVPILWIPDQDRPSQYVEHEVRPRKRPIGFR